MALCFCSLCAKSEFMSHYSYTYNGVVYGLNEDTKTAQAAVFNYSDRFDILDVVIPEYIEYNESKYRVISIRRKAFAGYNAIKSISIAGSIEEIGEGAFKGCTSLVNLRIEDSTLPIKVSYNTYDTPQKEYTPLFYDCPIKYLYLGRGTEATYPERFSPFFDFGVGHASTSIEQITIGKNVTDLPKWYFSNNRHLKNVECLGDIYSIGESCFEWCDSLTSINISSNLKSIGKRAFMQCHSLEWFDIPYNIKILPDSLFYECNSLKSVKLLHDIDTIGDYTFFNCHLLESINFGHRLKAIGEHAFHGCYSINNITLPPSLENIGEYAFTYCKNLSSINMPSSVDELKEGVFSNCLSLSSIGGTEHIQNIGKRAFSGCESLCTINLSDDLKELPDGLFYGCKSLVNFKFGNKIEKVGKETFCGCESLTLQNYQVESLKEIEDDAFLNCKSLKYIPISDTLISFGRYAFAGCSSIMNVEIPSCLLFIGERCFYNCTSLTTMTISDSEQQLELGLNCIQGCPIGTLYIGRNFTESAFRETDVRLISFGHDVTFIPKHSFANCKQLEQLIIPKSVGKIEYCAFYNDANINYLKIEDGANPIEIDASALEYTKPTDVYIGRDFDSHGYTFDGANRIVIGNLVSQINETAFRNNSTIEELVLGSCIQNIGNEAFMGISATEITIPPSVEIIGEQAFANNHNLQKIKIGCGIKNIQNRAFNGCSQVKEVYITAIQPPQLGYYVFNSLPTLYVPEGYLGLYNNWEWDSIFHERKGGLKSPTSIIVVPEKLENLLLGDSYPLTASIQPSDVKLKTLYYLSTNPNVATVDNYGRVTIQDDQFQDKTCEIWAYSLYADSPVAVCKVDLSNTGGIDTVIEHSPERIDFNKPYNVYNMEGLRIDKNINNLPKGIYIVTQGTISTKIFKQ